MQRKAKRTRVGSRAPLPLLRLGRAATIAGSDGTAKVARLTTSRRARLTARPRTRMGSRFRAARARQSKKAKRRARSPSARGGGSLARQRVASCVVERDQSGVSDELPKSSVSGQQIVFETEHEFAGEGKVGARDESQPERGQLRGQKRDFERQESPAAKACNPLQNLLAAEYFRARHIEPLAVLERHVGCAAQGSHDIRERDRLGARAQ